MKSIPTIRHDTGKRHAAKYANTNIIHQLVLGRFLDTCAKEISALNKGTILDFGCGEAFFWKEMEQRQLKAKDLLGIDLRADALARAIEMFPQYKFMEQDLMNWVPEDKFDLVIASQVLEHLPEPGTFLERLVSLSKGYILLTVPWEPFFRLSNFIRGRDIMRFGNHPEHVNQWNAKTFSRFVSKHARIVKSKQIFPFLMVIAAPK